MTYQTARRLDLLTSRLTETLMTAALCAQEIRAEILTELDDQGAGSPVRTCEVGLPSTEARPLVDHSTLCVTWRGQSVHLGHTRGFRFLERLARCPNQYVTHLDLLNDVWDDEDFTPATIRSVARHLRRRLRDEGLSELADAIRGHNGRYVLKV